MRLRLTDSLIYNGVLWPVGATIFVREEDAEYVKNFGEILPDSEVVESGEKSCVERDESDASADSPTITSRKARRGKEK